MGLSDRGKIRYLYFLTNAHVRTSDPGITGTSDGLFTAAGRGMIRYAHARAKSG